MLHHQIPGRSERVGDVSQAASAADHSTTGAHRETPLLHFIF